MQNASVRQFKRLFDYAKCRCGYAVAFQVQIEPHAFGSISDFPTLAHLLFRPFLRMYSLLVSSFSVQITVLTASGHQRCRWDISHPTKFRRYRGPIN